MQLLGDHHCHVAAAPAVAPAVETGHDRPAQPLFKQAGRAPVKHYVLVKGRQFRRMAGFRLQHRRTERDL